MRIHMFPEYSTIFTSQEKLYRYLYGGRAIVTLESPSGNKHTYSYEKPRNENSFPEDVIFVYAVHQQTDGAIIKFYLGMIENDNFRMTRNSRFGSTSEVMKGAFYIENLRKHQELLDSSPMIIYHQGTCGMCGSRITSDKSRDLGFGRKCLKMFKFPQLNIPDV